MQVQNVDQLSPLVALKTLLDDFQTLQRYHLYLCEAFTMSWSVIEYSAKYEAAGELNHVEDIIKWGSDYFLKTFNSTADDISQIIVEVNKYTCYFNSM